MIYELVVVEQAEVVEEVYQNAEGDNYSDNRSHFIFRFQSDNTQY